MQGRERVMVVVVSKMEGLVSLINNDEQKRKGVRDGLSVSEFGRRNKLRWAQTEWRQKRLLRMTEDRTGWWSMAVGRKGAGGLIIADVFNEEQE